MKISVKTPVILLTTLVALSGCGKSVNTELGTPGPDGGIPRLPPGLVDTCGAAEMRSWDFVQPQPTVNRSVDLLFVMDTSASLDSERRRMAATIPAFVNALDAGTDYRLGVMLAHGGASSHAGRLYSATGVPKILDSRIHSPAQVQNYLEKNLRSSPQDRDEANGEMMLYSFSRSLDADRKAELQAQGFYREGAALSVVLISDENDVCFRPELNGYTAFPDFVPSYKGTEITAWNRYCLNADRTLKITPESVLERAKALKTNEKFSMAAITHVDPLKVPKGGEDAIGHGLIEFAQKELNSVLMDISDSYEQGLRKLGNVVSVQLKLDTAFNLNSGDGLRIRPDSIMVQVDGTSVRSVYDSAVSRVRIQTADAGRAGSLVHVTACVQ